jgi:hypothetical protein
MLSNEKINMYIVFHLLGGQRGKRMYLFGREVMFFPWPPTILARDNSELA